MKRHRTVDPGTSQVAIPDEPSRVAAAAREPEYPTLLGRIQCLGMLGAITGGAAGALDLEARVDALSNMEFVNSPRLTHEHLGVIQRKCARLGQQWRATPLTASHLPAALWQHVDGFLPEEDSIWLMATCRHLAALTLDRHPLPEAHATDPNHLLQRMRAAPGRFAHVTVLSFRAFLEQLPWQWDALAAAARAATVHTLAGDLRCGSWLALVRCFPRVRAIQIEGLDRAWWPADLSRLLAAARECTSLVADVRFDEAQDAVDVDDSMERLVVPARVTHLEVGARVRGGIVFEDASRILSLTLPHYHMPGDVKPMHPFSGLERLYNPEILAAPLIGALPRLLELSVNRFELRDGAWIPDSLQHLRLSYSKLHGAGLAHCLRPASQLVSVHCTYCRYFSADAFAKAFSAVAAVGSVAPALRDLVLPRVRSLAAATAALRVAATVNRAAFEMDEMSFGFLGRESHAAPDPSCGPLEILAQRQLRIPAGLQLLLESNRCAVSLGAPLVFQAACSANCVHTVHNSPHLQQDL